MNIQVLTSLEYQRIRSALVDRAASGPGRALAATLSPAASQSEAEDALACVAEALAVRLSASGWPTIRFETLEEVLEIARTAGAVLEALPLLDCAAALRVAGRIATFFRTPERAERYPLLAARAALLLTDKDFVARVERSFEPSGEVRDEASTALRGIRQKMRRRQGEVSRRLEGMGRAVGGPAEETLVTLRGGRYVLSLPATGRRRINGIVHDRSATGKTVYLEPLEIVELNNSLAEIAADERIEIHRILRELSDWVRNHADQLAATEGVLAELDEIGARARLAADLKAVTPQLDRRAGSLRIVKGRHPLLQLAGGRAVVPLDLELSAGARALVISGPNMGGKTVVLKTAGLLVLMAMSGLYVPAADGTILPWVDEIFVDIGDQQSLEFDLSTYAGHLRTMEAILRAATAQSLVLIDELGAGTDPDEGAALGMALLGEIAARGSLCITTTHLGAFKAFAANTPSFRNAAMEHDPETLAPTYTLNIGLPGRSHAFELAKRERWPAPVLEQARACLSEDRLRTETLLTQIQEQRANLRAEWERAAQESARLARAREEAARLSDELQEKLAAVAIEKALEEDRRLRELKRMLTAVKERIRCFEETERSISAEQERQWVHAQEREAAALRKTAPEVPRRASDGGRRSLTLGELAERRTAYSRSLGLDVKLGEREQDGERIWVYHRGLKVRVPITDLAQSDETEAHEARETVPLNMPGEAATRAAEHETVSGEVDLRGQDRESCLRELDRFLDRVYLAGLTRVRIVHGKGTGVLRRAVQEFLRVHPHIQSCREGEAGEGGWGVTIAFLKSAAGKK